MANEIVKKPINATNICDDTEVTNNESYLLINSNSLCCNDSPHELIRKKFIKLSLWV